MPTADLFNRPVFARTRRACLALPEVTEKPAWRHPTFRVAKKTFVAFEMIKGRPSIAFRLPPDTCTALIEEGVAFATPYGRNMWASVWVDQPFDVRTLRRLVQASYRTIAPVRLIRPAKAGTHA
jgi:predicted DNA-binding protein (MmcQ/YjbR family)